MYNVCNQTYPNKGYDIEKAIVLSVVFIIVLNAAIFVDKKLLKRSLSHGKNRLIGVNKSFKEEKVLKDICLTLTDNKIYGFVGRNGSGKSVLFKIICGYVIADSGKIMIDGKELGKDMDFPEGLGALIETPGFIWYQSGFETYVIWLVLEIKLMMHR